MGDKGQTKTSSFQIPAWEQQDWQNLLGKVDNTVSSSIASENIPGLQKQITQSSQNILDNQVDPNALKGGIIAAGQPTWADPGTAESYMNPYTTTALKQGIALDRAALLDPALAASDSRAAASGALGGDRQAVERAQIVNNFNNTESARVAQGMNDAYAAGQGAFETDAQRRLAAETAGAQTGLAGNNSNIYANYAATQNGLNGIVAGEAPMRQLSQEAGILAMLPRQGTSTEKTTPNGSMLGGIMGGILGGAGTLLKGFGLKRGGIVDLANKPKKSKKGRGAN